ncbi:hypothetical protein PCASD_15975 [Puccinia coronata f. sp. avenae]|uniref:mRNA-decapping enzyme C-terminal domain-containing protein n=1 Tax=Puccinia coronata f. sp. avenae TaxID=200324 RepID=A0A2N5TVQ6_9BASI|nr:hypothetical protein PCASD_15975 [Puccinia coronata f. sp. avenae]
MDPRTINFNVLRRHDPQIASIIDSTSYAVIYRYFHGAWSKTGFEGTLFLFQRHVHPHHGLFVLNRQGLDNLCEGLLAGWDVDLDEGLIIWRSAGATGDADDDVIYGIWVYEEKDRTRIATTMQELIENASEKKKGSPQHSPPSSSPPPVSLSHPVPRVPIITAGQTISLDQLFGVGSVCSEPPPQTSALPHPGASVTDPEEEEKENLLPSQVMSPDPSDLPKGMQLLDSLFQRAAVKSHPGGAHQSNPIKPELLANQHPTSIHQLINQASGPTSQISPQSSTNNTRDRRQSSAPENFKHQPAPIDQSAQPNHHRPMNQQQRNDYRSRDNHHHNTNPHSRRSSGGSSSHSRNAKLTMSHNHTTQPHQHTQPPTHHQHPLNPVNIVAAPVPIENANAEARHNILSLLGHPAAARSDDVYSSGTNPQNPMFVSPPPAGNQQPVWPNSSPDSRGGSNPRNLYSPQQHQAPQQTGPGNHQAYDSPRSRVPSQEASPHQHTQQGVPQHPLPVPSYGNPTDRTPPRGPTQVGSANHSPNGPRPQVDLRHHHHAHQPQPPPTAQPPVGANHLTAGGLQEMSIPNGGPAGPGFTTSVWPFDKLPNRALSPLNPARQSPSNLVPHRGGRGGGGYPQTHHMNNRKSFQPPRHQQQQQLQQQQQQQQQPVDHSPPLVNDSSRPSRSHSYTDATNSHDRRASAHSTHHHSPSSNAHPPPPPIVVNSKLAVESLDQLLAAHSLENGSGSPRHSHQLEDANPLDKAHFVHAILDLINNNGAFVDTLYARYLARYAEKYL